MRQEYVQIFNRCFPEFKMSSERFAKLLHSDKCNYYDYSEGDEVLGFAITEDVNLRLICVIPEKQKRGIGTALLSEVEEELASKDIDKIITGGTSSDLFIGAVEDSWGFFEKNGYIWKDAYEEMLINLKDFSMESYKLRGHKVAEYGWFVGNLEEIKKAVAAVDESWVPYFNKADNIYVGRVNGEIASFCLVDKDCQNYLTDVHGRVGMPGCVGTVPKFRNQGIAIEMIARATEYLKEEGMDISFIFFTGVAKWYEQLGYKTFLKEIFGEKKL